MVAERHENRRTSTKACKARVRAYVKKRNPPSPLPAPPRPPPLPRLRDVCAQPRPGTVLRTWKRRCTPSGWFWFFFWQNSCFFGFCWEGEWGGKGGEGRVYVFLPRLPFPLLLYSSLVLVLVHATFLPSSLARFPLSPPPPLLFLYASSSAKLPPARTHSAPHSIKCFPLEPRPSQKDRFFSIDPTSTQTTRSRREAYLSRSV